MAGVPIRVCSLKFFSDSELEIWPMCGLCDSDRDEVDNHDNDDGTSAASIGPKASHVSTVFAPSCVPNNHNDNNKTQRRANYRAP